MKGCLLLVVGMAMLPALGPRSDSMRKTKIGNPPGFQTATSAGAAVPRTATLAHIAVSYKMDPRLATGQYGGERWVSPATYTRVGDKESCTIETRVKGLAANGRPAPIVNPRWTPSDPRMVTVTPEEGTQVTMTVLRPGQSTVRVSSQGVTRELVISAAYQNRVLQVEITQK